MSVIFLLVFFVFQKNEDKISNENEWAYPKLIAPYDKLPNSDYNSPKEKFTDSLLKVSFNYPTKYFPRSVKADENEALADIVFIKERNADREQLIDDVLNCILTNRTNPSGMCRESLLGDVEVGISTPKGDPDNVDHGSEDCVKQIISEDKILYSCSTLIAPGPSSDYAGVNYDLYIKGNSPRRIGITTGKPEQYSDLIKSIVETSKVLP
ncbi:MAG TPA: hypothetical protein VLE91_00325 [Candidatus Saccharimonadales bacterium]|nr:hypothetical protein [Candidatus Saccharimonadales bacterium]